MHLYKCKQITLEASLHYNKDRKTYFICKNKVFHVKKIVNQNKNIYKSKHKHTVIATVSVLTRLDSQLTSSKRNARKNGTLELSVCQIIENTQTNTQATCKCVRLYVSSLTRCEFHIYLTYTHICSSIFVSHFSDYNKQSPLRVV